MNPRFSCLIAPASQFKKESSSSYGMSDQIFSLLKGIDESNIQTLDELLLPVFNIK